jgi:RNA polymerase sigma-70 factor (family 1)
MMPEDQELLAKIRKGDNYAFKLLFQRYYSGLFNFGMSLLKREDETRELIQDIFLQLWDKKSSLAIANTKSYLFTTMHHKALNLLRHEKVIRAYEQNIISLDSLKFDNPKESNPFVKEALIKAIDELPDKAKQCFILSQIDGLSHKEVADQLNITEKTVENHLARCRKDLRKKLKNYR